MCGESYRPSRVANIGEDSAGLKSPDIQILGDCDRDAFGLWLAVALGVICVPAYEVGQLGSG